MEMSNGVDFGFMTSSLSERGSNDQSFSTAPIWPNYLTEESLAEKRPQKHYWWNHGLRVGREEIWDRKQQRMTSMRISSTLPSPTSIYINGSRTAHARMDKLRSLKWTDGQKNTSMRRSSRSVVTCCWVRQSTSSICASYQPVVSKQFRPSAIRTEFKRHNLSMKTCNMLSFWSHICGFYGCFICLTSQNGILFY